MSELSVLGIDTAKLVFHAVGMNQWGKVVLRKRLRREQLMMFIASIPRTLVCMESCAGSHYWARKFQLHGHEVRLIAAKFVKPYVKSNKNDAQDAEAIAEAGLRPTMRFVEVKTETQQDIQSLHRIRERLVTSRTALINEMRGLLSEYGIVIAKGINNFRHQVVEKMTEESEKLTSPAKHFFQQLHQELQEIEERIAHFERILKDVFKAHPECQRLASIPGIAFLTATALIASIGDISRFKNGRQLAAWLGLVPRQHSTGGKPRLGRISKRGNSYLRKLLIHGARADLRWIESKKKTDRRSCWARGLKQRSGANKTAVALANKTARIVWVVLSKDEQYRRYEPAAA